MREWVMALRGTDLPALGAVRTTPGLQAAEGEGLVWLRTGNATAELPAALRTLPAVTTWQLGTDGLLYLPAHSVPSAALPTLRWLPLPQFLPVETLTSALPGQVSGHFPVRLTQAPQEHPSTVLRLPLAQLIAYAETAPEVRLNALRYAVSAQREALVMGTPLLPLPGQAYWLRGQMILPAGWDFDPPAVGELVQREMLGQQSGWVLWEADGRWEKVDEGYWMPLSRSGLRTLGEEVRNG